MSTASQQERAPLESVIITDQLQTRTRRTADDRAVILALMKLAQTMTNDPDSILQTLVESSRDLCSAHSAGISILRDVEGKPMFRWDAVVGDYAPFLMGTLPREFSPCGTVLDTGAIQLMRHPERHFLYLADVSPFCAEVLLVPFHVDGKAVGTIWIVAHDESRKFDARDVEVMKTLREFASAAYQTTSTMAQLQKLLEETRTNEALTRGAIESNPDCVKVLDLDGRMLSMNQNGCRLMEVDDFNAVANLAWTEFWEDPEIHKARAALDAARTGSETRFSASCRTAKGNERFWDVTVSPILDAGGKPKRILSVARDTTASRKQEAQLRETAKLESLGVLAGGIAHDFNNLLTGVLGNASLLQMSANRADAELADEIVNAAERAATLTTQMLAYSGKGQFVVARLDLSKTIRGILALIRTTIDRKVETVLSLDEHLPPIEADPAQMDQLIMNLVTNASESMDGAQGTVHVATSAVDIGSGFSAQTFRGGEPCLAEGRYVRFEVRDTGSGMNAETASRIFDPFFTTKFTGRGLGLAAVSGIVRGHRGGVRVRSELGQGTTIQVFLPVVPNEKTPEEKTLAFGVPAASVAPGQHLGTILFADDEETVRRIAKTALQRSGYRVLLAETGKEAIDIFSENRGSIQLVIMDVTMPVMDGDEAISVLRVLDPRIPILLSSGYNQVDVLQNFACENITGFIQKPYGVQKLIEAVSAVLARG